MSQEGLADDKESCPQVVGLTWKEEIPQRLQNPSFKECTLNYDRIPKVSLNYDRIPKVSLNYDRIPKVSLNYDRVPKEYSIIKGFGSRWVLVVMAT